MPRYTGVVGVNARVLVHVAIEADTDEQAALLLRLAVPEVMGTDFETDVAMSHDSVERVFCQWDDDPHARATALWTVPRGWNSGVETNLLLRVPALNLIANPTDEGGDMCQPTAP